MAVAVVKRNGKVLAPDRTGRLPIHQIPVRVVDDTAGPRTPGLPEVPVPVVVEPEKESRKAKPKPQ